MCFSQKIGLRRGFTLVELLLVIAIIAVMSTMLLAVLRGSQEDARNSATKSQLSQVLLILNQEVEEFAFKKLPFDITSYFLGYGIDLSAFEYRELRKRILADTLNVEMPRLDFNNNPVSAGVFPSDEFRQWLVENFDNRPSNGDTAGTEFADALNARAPANIYRLAAFGPSLDSNAECLTAILLGIRVNGTTGIEPLGKSAFVDFDNDGLPSLVDAWGDPVNFFIRYISDEDVNGDGEPDNRPLADGVIGGKGSGELFDAALYTNTTAFPNEAIGTFELGNIQVVVTSNNTF